MKERQKMALVESCVGQGLDRIQAKMEFWGKDAPFTPYTLWEREGALGERNLPEILKSINVSHLSPEERAIVGIAWEFVWGEKTPEEIIQARDELIAKVKFTTSPVSEIEKLWFWVATADTDLF